MTEGHRSKLLRTDPYKTNCETDFYHVVEDIGKKGNRSKKHKRNFAETENKIKNIMPTNTHRTKLMLQEKYINYIHQFENY
jgi:hypothetical protein